MNKHSSRKEKKQAARAQASRQKMMRFGGLAVIILMVIIGLIGWGNMDESAAGETAVHTAPLLDGPADAPIKVVEYADLTCSSCRQWHNTGIKEQLRADFGNQISFEYRHFPVITAASPRWAEAAQCAAEQELFWPFHDYIYENLEPYPTVNDARLQEIAAAIGLESESFESCLASGRYDKFVVDAIQRAQRDGVRGTPTFLINGQPVFPSYEAMAATINNLSGN
ncbi:MAG: thioredoxin domain-containing protein [Chloroflexi bacterium]|nr:thioredoxin domain-containing protein [Ardenticatenaceae bacterium]NOG35483.1 thioredoxin domain-containing protein [Chloroflexota bacterium]GIK57432.1 MAG: thiol:disulfide interchange protein [Chloroflexota bacterium]